MSPPSRHLSLSRDRKVLSCRYYSMVLLCFIGCAYHVIALSLRYFEYRTTSMYIPYLPMYQRMPDLSICSPPNNISASHFHGRTFQSVNTSQVIKDCLMRNFTSGRLESQDCSLIFSTTHFHQENSFTCYIFNLLTETKFSSLEMASTMKDKYILYKLTLEQNIINADNLGLFNHFTKFPQDELLYLRYAKVDLYPKRYYFILSYLAIEFKMLPSPYETNCIHQHPPSCSMDRNPNQSICFQQLCHRFASFSVFFQLRVVLQGISLEVRSIYGTTELITHVPFFQPSEFFMQAFNILGIWFTLSINSLARQSWRFLNTRSHLKSFPFTFRHRVCKLQSILTVQRSQRREMSQQRKGIASIIKLIIFIMFVREMSSISMDYFLFQTRVDTDVQMGADEYLPSVSFCFDVYEWFNLTEPLLAFQLFDDQMTNFSLHFNHTLQNLFDLTPDVGSIMRRCTLRPHPSSQLIQPTDCNNFFNVTKFYQSEMICYYFDPLFNRTIDIKNIFKGDKEPDLMYSISVSDVYRRQMHIQPILSRDLPRVARLLAPRPQVFAKNQLLTLTAFEYEYRNLPPPFDTNCVQDNHECVSQCLQSLDLKHLPYSVLHSRSIDQFIINYIDMKDQTFASQVNQHEIKCKITCGTPCMSFFTKTFLDLAISHDESLRLAVNKPMYPSYSFQVVALHSLYEFLYQLISSASFWAGFSFIRMIECIFKVKTMDRISHYNRSLVKVDSIQINPSRGRKYTKSFKLRRIIYLIILTIGFGIHSIIVTDYYFKYPVLADTRLHLAESYESLKYRACININQLQLNDNYSLANIWSQSPGVDDILIQCGFRGFNLPNLVHLPFILQDRIMPYINSSSVCRSIFKWRKLITLGMVCYEFESLHNLTQSSLDIKTHIEDPRSLQYLTLSPTIARYTLTVIIFEGDSGASSLFLPTLGPTDSSSNQWYLLEHYKCIMQWLPFPYEAAQAEIFSQLECMKKCIFTETLNRTNLFSSYGEAFKPSQILHETFDESTSFEVQAIRNLCEKKCSSSPPIRATEAIYFALMPEGPHTVHRLPLQINGTNTLWFCSSGYYVPRTEFFPALRFVDLVIFIGSLYSIWFGISAVELVDSISVGSFRKNCNKSAVKLSVENTNGHLPQIQVKCRHGNVLKHLPVHRINFIESKGHKFMTYY